MKLAGVESARIPRSNRNAACRVDALPAADVRNGRGTLPRRPGHGLSPRSTSIISHPDTAAKRSIGFNLPRIEPSCLISERILKIFGWITPVARGAAVQQIPGVRCRDDNSDF